MNSNEQEVMDQEYMESVVSKEIPLIIYHASCMDGLGALWAAKQWLLDIEPYAASYGKAPPDVTDRVVYILDFSYPREVLIEMYAKAKSLVVLDHHESAMQALEGLEFAHFDMTRSGAVLAWEYFAELIGCTTGSYTCTDSKEAPPLLQYIQDRDLWHFSLPNSKEISEYLRAVIEWESPVEDNLVALDNIDEYWEYELENIVAMGGTILANREKQVAETVNGVFYLELILNSCVYSIPACFSVFSIRSEVGHALASLPDNEHKVGLSIQGMHNGKFGLSFRGLEGTDLALSLAQTFGGGGHKCASGAAIEAKDLAVLLQYASSTQRYFKPI